MIRQKGQAIVEFMVVAPLLILLACAIVDYGLYWDTRIGTAQAARDGARYASLYPTRWTSVGGSTPPTAPIPPDTIESTILTELQGSRATWYNTDQYLHIEYFDTTNSPYKECGYYSVSANGFVAESGYTEASCVKPGNEVYIELTSTYVPLTPFASTFLPGNPGGIDVNEAVSMIIE